MTTESIQIEAAYPVAPMRIYDVWLDPSSHARFTGGRATIDPVVGGKHTAHDDYIWGTFLELEPGRRIVQAWRTSEFPAEAHDSRVEVLLEEIEGGTRVTIVHSNIPEGQGEKYRGGWKEFYLEPLALFLAPPDEPSEPPVAPAPKKKAKRAPPKKAAKKRAPRKAVPKKRPAKKAAKKPAAKRPRPKARAKKKKKTKR